MNSHLRCLLLMLVAGLHTANCADTLSMASVLQGVKRALAPSDDSLYNPLAGNQDAGVDLQNLLGDLMPDGWKAKFEQASNSLARQLIDAAKNLNLDGTDDRNLVPQNDALDAFSMCGQTRALCDFLLCQMRNFQKTGQMSDPPSLTKVLKLGDVQRALADPAFVGTACAEAGMSDTMCKLFTEGANLMKSFVGFLLPSPGRVRRSADERLDAKRNQTSSAEMILDGAGGASNETDSAEGEEKSWLEVKWPAGKPPVELPTKQGLEDCAALLEDAELF